MERLLSVMINITTILSSIYIFYYIVLSIFGFFKAKQHYQILDDQLKFCIFVPCHNEENVIRATVKNLTHIEYNSKLFDIYFIADHCTDKTPDFIQECIEECSIPNFIVLERNDEDHSKKGKPHALQWGIQELEGQGCFYGYYDMFMVLDADNFVDCDILKHFNSQYGSFKEDEKPELIQCYLDSKNANSMIARGYQVGYRISNRFFQLAKSRLGLNCAIGGTGFVITTSFLKELGGFRANSLTEDLEIQTLATILEKRIVHNFQVRIYDEKPTEYKQSFVQKTRWAQGHWWNTFINGPKLFASIFHSKNIRSIFSKVDNLIYLFTMMNYTIIVVSFILNIIAFSIGLSVTLYLPFISFLILFNFAYQYFIVYPYAVLKDGAEEEKKKLWKEYFINIIAVLLSGLIFALTSISGLFKWRNQRVWVKTKHSIITMYGGHSMAPRTILIKSKK